MDKVCYQKPRNVDDLTSFIRNILQVISEQRDLCQNVCQKVKKRLENFVNCDGQQFEHLHQ